MNRWCVVLFAASVMTSGLAQTLSYTQLKAEGSQPSPRVDGTIAANPPGKKVYLFGGQDPSPKNDLWVFSTEQKTWEELQVSGTRPPARFGHTLLYDTVRERLIVFGGQASGFFSDVWAFDIGQRAWQQLSPNSAGPSKRYGHSAIYDAARDRMVISHGFTDAGRFDDTWAFDLTANSWRNLTPSGTKPLRRCLHHAVYDHGNSQMLLFGGCASGFGPCPLGDLWAFDLKTNQWAERTGGTKPSPREHYGRSFDAAGERMLLFGGNGGGLLNDTWEFSVRSGGWQQTRIAGAPPSPRHRHESAYAPEPGATYFFGGSTSGGMSNELWMLGRPTASTRPEIASAGDGAVAPGEIVSIFGTGLGPVNSTAFAFDAAGQLPSSGPGLSVTWNGIPSPLYFASAGQLNVQAPYELSGSSDAQLVVTVNGQASAPLPIKVVPTHPVIFSGVWNQDGAMNAADRPAGVGEVIVLYASGQGVTLPASRTGAAAVSPFPEPAAPVTLRIGGVNATILFRGQAPGTAGVMQINARVPEGVSASSSAPLVLKVGETESQPGVVVAVR